MLKLLKICALGDGLSDMPLLGVETPTTEGDS